MKFKLISITVATLLATSLSANTCLSKNHSEGQLNCPSEIKKDCTEVDKSIRIIFITGWTTALVGPLGLPIGLALGALAHGYECPADEMENLALAKINKNKIEVNTQKNIEKTVEFIAPIKNYPQFALFTKDKIDPIYIHDDIKELDNDAINGIVIIGHASSPGSDKYNNSLGLKRAISMVKKLSLFIDKSKLAVSTKGESEAIFSPDYNNQRVQLIIDYKDGYQGQSKSFFQ